MAHVCRICMRMAISITPAPRRRPCPPRRSRAALRAPRNGVRHYRYVYYSGPRRSVLLFGRYPPHIAFLYCRARWYCHNYDVVSPRSRVKMQ
jgi:hypothetical protein